MALGSANGGPDGKPPRGSNRGLCSCATMGNARSLRQSRGQGRPRRSHPTPPHRWTSGLSGPCYNRSEIATMQVALLSPPPWKIASPGEPPAPDGEGPPEEYAEGDLDGDFFQTPYGLFALGAQALRAGHSVKVINLSAFTWTKVEEVLRALRADVYGLSCWTANRRGVALVAREIKRLQPEAHVVVGGPHATPLAREMLVHHPAIDIVSITASQPTIL